MLDTSFPGRLRLALTRISAIASLTLLGALPASGSSLPPLFEEVQGSALDGPWSAAFHLESIRIEGLRHAKPELLLTESRLEEGRSYDEPELGRAIDRIRRLPFVRDASFALRKGSRRGEYQLVITVEETRQFFFGSRLQSTEFSAATTFDPGGRNRDESRDPGLLAGVRLFTGRYGVAFLAVEENRAVVGYSRNQIAGRPISLRLGYERTLSELHESRVFGASSDPQFGPWTLSDPTAVTVAVTLPVGRGDNVGLDFEHRRSDSGYRAVGLDFTTIFFVEDFTDDRLTATWFRDTTDDGVFAGRGFRLVGTLGYRQVRANLFRPVIAGERYDPAHFDSRSLRAGALAGRWWPLGSRQTVWARVQIAAATTQLDQLPFSRSDHVGSPLLSPVVIDVSYESAELAVAIGHRLRLSGDGRDDGAGSTPQEVYWESSIEVARDEALGSLVAGVLEQFEARTGFVWRTSWGVFRIDFRYVDARQAR